MYRPAVEVSQPPFDFFAKIKDVESNFETKEQLNKKDWNEIEHSSGKNLPKPSVPLYWWPCHPPVVAPPATITTPGLQGRHTADGKPHVWDLRGSVVTWMKTVFVFRDFYLEAEDICKTAQLPILLPKILQTLLLW